LGRSWGLLGRSLGGMLEGAPATERVGADEGVGGGMNPSP